MGHAADFVHALLETGLVTGEVVANQLAIPGTQKVACMFTGAAWAEVVDHSPKCRERRGAVSPDISAMSFLLPGFQHLHWRFVGADNRGDIELHRRAGKSIPLGWAVDEDGQPITDPTAAMAGAMLTFGGHKGAALAAMVELMAGAPIGDMTSKDSMTFDGGVGATPCHGELIIAVNPSLLGGTNSEAGVESAERMFDDIVTHGARLPSQRRFEARRRSHAAGVSVSSQLLADIHRLLD